MSEEEGDYIQIAGEDRNSPSPSPFSSNQRPPRDREKTDSQWSCIMTIFDGVNVLAGAGLLSTPFAIKEAGWFSLLLLPFFAVLRCYTSILLQYHFKSKKGTKSKKGIKKGTKSKKGSKKGTKSILVQYHFKSKKGSKKGTKSKKGSKGSYADVGDVYGTYGRHLLLIVWQLELYVITLQGYFLEFHLNGQGFIFTLCALEF